MPIEGANLPSFFEVPKTPSSPRRNVLFQLREAAAAPSPLAQFLEDPAVIELSRLKHKSGPKGSRKTPSITQLALVEEERKSRRCRITRALTLKSTKNRSPIGSVTVESSRSQAEGEHERYVAESRRYQIGMESAERELQRLKSEYRRTSKIKDDFEEASMKAEELNRHYQNKLLRYQIRGDSMEQGRQLEMVRCFDEGREEGWTEGNEEGFDEGRSRGYEEGREAGRKEGLLEGGERGRIEERRKALEAFDKFLSEETGGL
ncbi:hypothetical protein FPV67DRAFT_1448272 [Lyophyllum atratum]|nr:hypothetical protein FPV67DRAFT_1448272 [Lyophyllum atratum]